MSNKRQIAILSPQGHASAELTTLSYDFPDGYVIPSHFHTEDQLVYAAKGVMTVRTDLGLWVVPPQRAVWIPAKVAHTIAMSGAVMMRTLYFVPKFVKSLPRTCQVLTMSPLLRELSLHACLRKKFSKKVAEERHVIDIIVDQLLFAPLLPLQLPQPTDKRALKVVSVLLADPSDTRTLSELCLGRGASKRTMERLFLEETAMTFGKWRQQLRLLHAMRLLATGAQVTTVALEAGYATPSAFISMFRKMLGTTPAKYFESEMP